MERNVFYVFYIRVDEMLKLELSKTMDEAKRKYTQMRARGCILSNHIWGYSPTAMKYVENERYVPQTGFFRKCEPNAWQ